MQEPYEEGPASHLGPESCAVGREAAGEALTGVRTDAVLSCVISQTRGAAAVEAGVWQHQVQALIASLRWTPRSRRPAVRPELRRTGPERSRGCPAARADRAGQGRRKPST